MKALARNKVPSTSARGRFRLLIKEAGSSPLTSGGADAFDETVVIAQMKGETPVSFAQRAIERITGLQRAGRRLSAATLQTGTRHDPATSVARRSILVALLNEAGLGAAMSEVLLEAACDAGSESAGELLSLVDELLQLPECDALPVRLRFEGLAEPSPEADSGVFWAPPSGSSA
jgi:hypothetical protein